MRKFTLQGMAYSLVLVLFAATVSLSLFVPIYTDEIAGKLPRLQAMQDAFQITSLFPQCGAPFALSVPWSWYPGVAIDNLLFGHLPELIYLRVIGILLFILWLGVLAGFLRKLMQPKVGYIPILASLAAFMSLGVLPFAMTLSRPEMPIILGISILCFLPFYIARCTFTGNWNWIALVAGFLLVVAYVLYSHPKVFFFTPLMLISAIHIAISSRRVWVGIALVGGIAWCNYESLTFVAAKMSCTDAPQMDAILKAQSLPLGMLFAAPREFILAGLHSLAGFYLYIKHDLFHLSYQSFWLPSLNDQKLGWAPGLVNVSISMIFLWAIGYVIYALSSQLIMNWKVKKLVPAATIPLALFLGVAACAFFLLSKNFYESSFFLALLLLMLVLLMPVILESNKLNRFGSIGLRILLVTSIASQSYLIWTYSAYAANSWLMGGKVNEQPLSVSAFNYYKIREEIQLAAADCGIKVGDYNQHLVVDDSTYFPFKNAHEPFHLLYLADSFGRDIGNDKLVQFLKAKESAGVVANCTNIPHELMSTSRRHGNYCCIGQREINTLNNLVSR